MLKRKHKGLIIKLVILLVAIISVGALVNFSTTPQVVDRTIVSMLGIDREEEGKISLTAKMLVATSGLLDSEFRQDISSAEGRTVFEAVRNLTVASGRKVELSLTGIIVVGEDTLREGFLDIAKELFEARFLSPGTILIACEERASEFVVKSVGMGERTSQHFTSSLAKFAASGIMADSSLLKFLQGEMSISQASLIPIVKLNEKDDLAEGMQDTVDIYGVSTAYVTHNGKLAAVLGEEELKGYIFVEKHGTSGIIGIDSFNFKNEQFDKPVIFEFVGKRVKMNGSFVGGRPEVTISISLKVRPVSGSIYSSLLRENAGRRAELNSELSKALKRQIEEKIQKSVEASKELGVDYFGFLRVLARRNYRRANGFIANTDNSFFTELTVKTNVRISII